MNYKYWVQHKGSQQASMIVETDRPNDFMSAAEHALYNLGYSILDKVNVHSDPIKISHNYILSKDVGCETQPRRTLTLPHCPTYGCALEDALDFLGYYTPIRLEDSALPNFIPQS